MEEEVFDDMVRHLFRNDPKKMDDDDIKQEHLYKALSTLIFEGCTFSTYMLHLNYSIYKQFMDGEMQALTHY